MKSIFGRWTMAAAMVFTLFLAGLVMAGTAFSAGGQQCVDNEDGTVTDKNTGLMWQKATVGPMNKNDAMNYVSGLSLGGHSDWRLPTRYELKRLYLSQCKSMMNVLNDWYWSSSLFAVDPDYAWGVAFDNGYVSCNCYVGDDQYVRAVRAGQ